MPRRRRVRERAKRPATSPELADLGVLFVHGIGDQEKGDTLGAFKPALTDWLAEWFAGDPTRFIVLEELTSSDHSVKAGVTTEPANARIQLREERQGGESRSSTWVLAESWWAKDFKGPSSFLELARWLFSLLPWIAIWHVLMPLLRWGSSPAPGTVLQLRLYVAWMSKMLKTQFFIIVRALLIGAFAVVVLLLLLGRLFEIFFQRLGIPTRGRGLATYLASRASAYLGDCYALVAYPQEFKAMVGCVLRDVHWLEERCRSVVIVAHSQGAAISHEALRSKNLNSVKLFVGIGSGTAPLHVLRYLRESGRWWAGWLATVAIVVFEAGVILGAVTAGPAAIQGSDLVVSYLVTGSESLFLQTTLISAGRYSEAAEIANRMNEFRDAIIALHQQHFITFNKSLLAYLNLPFLLGLALILLSMKVFGFSGLFRSKAQAHRLRGVGKRLKWVEFYATADPVSNGPLLEDYSSESVPVSNRNNFFRDHDFYRRNQDEFLPRLILELAKVADPPCKLLDDSADLFERARWQRQRRIHQLTAVRWMVLILGLALYWPAVFFVKPAGFTRGWAEWMAAWGLAYLAFVAVWPFAERRQVRRFFQRDVPAPVKNKSPTAATKLVALAFLGGAYMHFGGYAFLSSEALAGYAEVDFAFRWFILTIPFLIAAFGAWFGFPWWREVAILATTFSALTYFFFGPRNSVIVSGDVVVLLSFLVAGLREKLVRGRIRR